MQPPTTQDTDAPPFSIALRPPTADDGVALHELVISCPPLDPNSLYCNLLHCTHFAATSVAAVSAADKPGQATDPSALLGFISAFVLPQQQDTLFVWQVAVAKQARGHGLGGQMLDHLLRRPSCVAVRYVNTTVTPSNRASWAMFESWAHRQNAAVQSEVCFDRERHLAGRHEQEMLIRIGPLTGAARSPG